MDMTMFRRRGLLLNTPHIVNESGSIVTFDSAYNKVPIKSLTCSIEPIQEGTGNPSPDNVRPISGWTGVSVVRTGVNVWDEELVIGSYDSNEKTVKIISDDRAHLRSANPITVKPNTTYYMNTSGFNVHIIVADPAGNVLYRSVTLNNASFTTPEKAAYVYFNTAAAYGLTYNNDISINYPSTDHEYCAYSGQIYSITFPTEAGTVYGGTLDVVSEKLTVDSAYIASYNGETLPSTWISDRDVYAEGTAPTTGAQVVYKLANPVEYQLTPQEIRTLLGENNIWCNSGDISIDYWKWGN